MKTTTAVAGVAALLVLVAVAVAWRPVHVWLLVRRLERDPAILRNLLVHEAGTAQVEAVRNWLSLPSGRCAVLRLVVQEMRRDACRGMRGASSLFGDLLFEDVLQEPDRLDRVVFGLVDVDGEAHVWFSRRDVDGDTFGGSGIASRPLVVAFQLLPDIRAQACHLGQELHDLSACVASGADTELLDGMKTNAGGVIAPDEACASSGQNRHPVWRIDVGTQGVAHRGGELHESPALGGRP